VNGIDELLFRLGIMPNLVGHKYLKYGVELLLEDPERIQYVTKDLYPAIAKYYGTTWISVEHGIRTAVQICWKKGNRMLLDEVAGYYLEERPTVSEFFAIIVMYFQNRSE